MFNRTRESSLCLIALFVGAICFSSLAQAQTVQGPTTIRNSVHHDLSLPLSEMAKHAAPPDLSETEAESMNLLPLQPGFFPIAEDRVRQSLTSPSPSAIVDLSFEGLGANQYGWG